MKDIRPALRAYLLADAAILALVDSTEKRIYSIRLEQGQTAPSIVYNRITEATDYNMQGGSGLIQSFFQIDAWAQTHDAAVTLANAVHDRLSGQRGSMLWGTNSPQDSVITRGVFSRNGREDYDNTAQMYRMSRDYEIWYLDRDG